MAAGIYNFTIEQGTTFIRTFKYKDSNGDALNLSSHSIRMQLRTSINNDFTIISLTEASMSFDTAVYDLEIESSSVVTRLLQGKIKLSKEVTR